VSKEFKILPSTIEAIRQVITSDAWESFFLPALRIMKQEWSERLMDPSQARKDKWPDDFIRGCFETIHIFETMGESHVLEHDAMVQLQEQARALSGDREERASLGKVGP